MNEAKALSIVPRPANALSTMSVADVKAMAEQVAESGLFAKIRTPQAAFTLMMLCQAEGLHPVQALRRFDIVDGKPSLKTDAMLADFQAAGGSIEWKEVTHEAVEGVFSAPSIRTPLTVRWTIDDAKRAGLMGKDNWKGYPRQMMKARVISEGLRLVMPGIVVGLYSPEEVMDFDAPKASTIPAIERTTYTPPAVALSAMSSAEPAASNIADELVDEPASDEMVWEYARENKRAPWEPIRQAEKASNAQLAAIHILKAKCKFTEALWKSRLMANFGVDTSALLSKRCASELIDKLEDKAAHQAEALERAHVEMEAGLQHIIAEEKGAE